MSTDKNKLRRCKSVTTLFSALSRNLKRVLIKHVPAKRANPIRFLFDRIINVILTMLQKPPIRDTVGTLRNVRQVPYRYY